MRQSWKKMRQSWNVRQSRKKTRQSKRKASINVDSLFSLLFCFFFLWLIYITYLTGNQYPLKLYEWLRSKQH